MIREDAIQFFSWDENWVYHSGHVPQSIEPTRIHGAVVHLTDTLQAANWTVVAAAMLLLPELRRVLVRFVSREGVVRFRETYKDAFAGLQNAVEFVYPSAQQDGAFETYERLTFSEFHADKREYAPLIV